MIQTYNDISQEIQYFQTIFEGTAQIQKIYSSSYYISIQVRLPGRNHFIVLGRGHGQEGLWNSDKQIESFLRKRDRFLEYLRKFLSSSVLQSIEQDSKDRIIKLTYRRLGQRHVMMFFYCGRELYFANRFFNEKKHTRELFCSWKGTQDDDLEISDFDIFDEIGRKEVQEKNKFTENRKFSTLIKQELKKAEATALGGKSLKFLKRKKKKIQEDIKNIQLIPELEKLTQLEDLTTLPMKNKVGTIKLNFKEKEHFKRRDEVFKKIKKLKKAKGILELRLQDTETKLLQIGKKNNLQNTLKTITPQWMNKREVEAEVKTEASYKTLKYNGLDLAIGTSARGNDEIRKNWAKKDDIWFHLDGDKSPHIIVKLKGKILDDEIFNLVSVCMQKFGKIEAQEVGLIYTPVKNLKGVKGSPGKVIYKKEKRRKVYVQKTFDNYFNSN